MDTDEQADLRHKDAGKSTYRIECILLQNCNNHRFRASHSKKLYEVFQFFVVVQY